MISQLVENEHSSEKFFNSFENQDFVCYSRNPYYFFSQKIINEYEKRINLPP